MPAISLRLRPIHKALGKSIPMPALMTAEAAGFDLPAAIDEAITLAPGTWQLVPCGFAMALPLGFEGQVRPRSGLAMKHGITVLNTPGTIDADYRGEVKVLLINLSTEAFRIEPGMRIAQLVICELPHVQVDVVEELPDSHRGEGGFGSTGR